jgi:SagB-type dehydrogenase family enzyme
MHRNYPSGGALFPIETYVVSRAVEGHAPSVFHYNPSTNALEKLWELPYGFDMNELVSQRPSIPFSTLIVFTSVWDRSSMKYGELAYIHALIEAGHMCQNLLLVSTALSLSARPMAGFDDASLIRLLDLDPENEQPVYTAILSGRLPASTSV